jgi:glycosyltransferase involved in cell wall biosynthesis
MHVMFIHPNFPAQFGIPAHYLASQRRWPCTFVTSVDTRHLDLPFTHINYRLDDNVPQPATFVNPDSLQGLLEHMAAIYRGLRNVRELRPDLVVGHMSYGTMLYLRNLYPCPFVGYFELFPSRFWGDGLLLRKEFPPPEEVRLANATYHALALLHLNAVDAGWTSTRTQFTMCPKEYWPKLRVIPDGVDCTAFQPRPRPAGVGSLRIGPETRVVTYMSRGLESVRGFDVFMQVAKRIGQRRRDVLFLVVGAERTNHGHELAYIGQQSFKQWVLSQDSYDLEQFAFLGLPPLEELTAVYNLSDLHIHLSVPYVPSPSLPQAMASGCPILGSATAPVQEYVDDGVTGRLVDFYDVEALTERALEMLERPEEARHLGAAARQRVLERYELGKCLERLTKFFQEFDRPREAAVDQAFAGL